MKKFLLATTALVATAGVAAADMAVTGYAEMGLSDSDSTDDTGIRFHQDVDVTFTGSGSTDSGLAFGFAVDLDEGSGTATSDDNDDGGVAIFLSSDFGTVTLGDTDGAMDWAMTKAGNIGNPSSLNDAETGHLGYSGSYLDGRYDGQILRYNHSILDIGLAFSLEMDDDTGASDTATGPDDGEVGSMVIALGAKYALDIPGGSLGLGGGFQTGRDVGSEQNLIDAGLSADARGAPVLHRIFNGLAAVPVEEDYDTIAFGVSAVYTANAGFSAGFQVAPITITTERGDETRLTHIGFGGGYATGPWSVHFNYGMWLEPGFCTGSSSSEDAFCTSYVIIGMSGYGLAAGYSLGGGASVKLGYGSSTSAEKYADAKNSLSVGLTMSF